MKKKDFEKTLELLKKEEESLLRFLKAKFPLFHNSNFFYRDFQYGILSFLEKKDITVTYKDADDLTKEMAEYFEKKGIFTKVNDIGWKVNYPEFATQEPGDPF